MIEEDQEVPSNRSIEPLEGSEPVEEVLETKQETMKIDRLSLLPNELLDHIFNLAHPLGYPSEHPLSKRLLPFHIFGIYRRIKLYSDRKFVALVSRVNRKPLLGDMIQVLHADISPSWQRKPCQVDSGQLETFYSHLNRVVEISITGRESTRFALSLPSTTFSALPLLSTVRTPLPPANSNPFRFFSQLTSLDELHIASFDTYFELDDDQTPILDLPFLTTLSIEGQHADQPSIADFCQSCPSLQDLTLTTFAADYINILPVLPECMTRLCLWEPPDHSGANHCDHFLPRFPNLVHLSLGSHLFSEDLTQHLAHLLSLEKLELGQGRFSIAEMIELVDGDLPELASLYLDSIKGVYGYRLECKRPGETNYFLADDEDFWLDWDIPDFSSDDGWGFEDAKELLTSALAAGIEIEGDLDWALVTMEAYLYEVANLAIIRSYLDSDLSHVENLQNDSSLNLRLPPIDLEKLDPDNLQLVQLSRSVGPCDYWDLDSYNLSLENRRNEEGEEEEERRGVELLDCELVVKPWPNILWK